MLSLKRSGIDPKRYLEIRSYIRTSLTTLAKEERTDKETRLLENLLLGVTRIGFLGEDQLRILWHIDKTAALAGKSLHIEDAKRIAAENMFDEIALHFVCKREHLQQVSTRCVAIKTRYLPLALTMAKYHDLEGVRTVAGKARGEVVDVLYKYDWHAEAITA